MDGGQVQAAAHDAVDQGAKNLAMYTQEPVLQPAKLFIGRVPKSMDESQLRPYFEPFGAIISITIIRDRLTGMPRGCAFCTYSTREVADRAIAALNGKIVLQPNTAPIQVQYADTEQDRQQKVKLFIGHIPKSANEVLLRPIFEQYGQIMDLTVYRDQEGNSRGCAFLRYTTRDSALMAIENLDGKYSFPDESKPIAVRFAETSQEKEQKRLQRSGYGMNPMGGMHPYMGHGMGMMGGNMGMMGGNMGMMGGNMGMIGTGMSMGMGGDMRGAIPSAMGGGLGGDMRPGGMNPNMGMQFHGPGMGQGYGMGMNSGFHPGNHGAHGHLAPGHSHSAPYPMSHHHNPPRQRGVEGPAGSNLFLYHLPLEWRDEDLRIAFSPFGNVISVLVYTDKVTGLSKGFGFVSYDNPISAAHAITTMNGYQVGNKHLKVTLKNNDRQLTGTMRQVHHQHPHMPQQQAIPQQQQAPPQQVQQLQQVQQVSQAPQAPQVVAAQQHY